MNSLNLPLLTKIQTKEIPATSFMRTWILGTSHAKVAAQYFAYIIQKYFADDDKKKDLQNYFQLKSALQLLGTMGYLKGAVMKAGQLIANFPQILPHEFVEIFEALHFEAPPMHFSLIREMFLNELGKEPEQIFAFFDKKAFAAASIGQVHRAILHNGKNVAVKIQYPNIAETIDADLKTLTLLLQTMRFKKDFKFLMQHIEDTKSIFLKEVDYVSEACFMEKNRLIFKDTNIVVPGYYPEFSTKKILTMEYLQGEHLNSFLAKNPSLEKRNHFAKLISYSLVHSWFRLRTAYADIHPGNYIFMDDGRLGFIDFGCYRQFNQDRWQLEIESETAMFNNDKEKLMHFLTKLSMHSCPEDLDPEWVNLFLLQMSWIIDPILKKGPFDFGNQAYVERGVRIMKKAIKKGYARLDPFYNLLNKALLGHRFLMYRLRSKFDYSSIYLSEMRKHSISRIF